MNSALAGWLQVGLLVLALAVCYKPVGDYMAHIFTTDKDWRVERRLYKLIGVDPKADQKWSAYLRSMLAFSLVSVLFLYALERLQHYLLLSLGMANVPPALAWNTAASFVTNTNWQNYSGESTMGYLVQMAGLAVQNFLSAAVGIVVAIAMVRGFIRSRTDKLGNFWVDVTRITIRYLIPLAIVGGLILVAAGAIDNFSSYHTVTTLSGAHQTIVGGPVASQEVIKDAGNNGGGFFNANSAHPFENPNPFTNWFEIFLLLLTAFCLPRTFGKMVKDNRQGYALLAVMTDSSGWRPSAGSASSRRSTPGSPRSWRTARWKARTSPSAHPGSVAVRGVDDGHVDRLGELVPRLVHPVRRRHRAVRHRARRDRSRRRRRRDSTASWCWPSSPCSSPGLMVGRTPEYIGKKIRPTEMKYAALYFLTLPVLILTAAGLSIGLKTPQASILNPGPHGLTEIMYAFTSMANNNGSAFAGLTTNTTWYNTVGGIVMLLGRFAPEIFALGLAGSLARQQPVPASAGTLETHKPLFVGHARRRHPRPRRPDLLPRARAGPVR